MGAVYRATDTKLNREVALKVLPDTFANDPDRLARFTREAQALAALNHPNIATVYGVEDRAIVMELVEGSTLADRIAKGALPLDEALTIARQIAEALEAAHEKGIVHRDLKPANVKVTPDGKVKVLDFGLAKLTDAADASENPASAPTLVRGNSPTLAGVIMGTAGYMAPEQARGLSVDKRTDVWAFGVVLFEMLVGKALFSEGETVADMIAAVVTRDPDWSLLPVATPASIRRLLRRTLERDRRKRLADIADARLEIDAAGDAEPVPSLTAKPPRGRLLPWLASVVAVVVAVVELALWAPWHAAPEPIKPARFDITLPSGVTANGPFSISPDGTKMTFWGTGADGATRLWLRAMNGVDFRALPGVETTFATQIFWSPDSRHIVVDIAGKLKKVDLAGGPPQHVSEPIQSQVFSGSWHRNGIILLGSGRDGIRRISAAGGASTLVTALNAARKDVRHTGPVFLPDGRHFVYTIQSAIVDNSGVFVGDIEAKPDAQDSRRLAETLFDPGFVPFLSRKSGWLLFQREGTLYAQPFDTRRLETSGEAVPVAERLGNQLNFGNFAASESQVIVIRSGGGGERQLRWYDRHGKILGDMGAPHVYFFSLRLSPDGTRIAGGRTEGQNADIWVMSLTGGDTRFTFDAAVDRNPAWSPDGSRIAFSSMRGAFQDIYQRASNGAGQDELLFHSDAVKFVTDWSPDGRFLLFYDQGGLKTQRDLWVLSMDAPNRQASPYLQTEFNERYGRFSPDGHWVAYESDESGRYEIYVKPFPSNRGGGKWMVSQGGAGLPAWRRDGKELFYLSADNHLMAVPISASGDVVQHGRPVALFKVPPNIRGWDVSADGSRFLMPTPIEGAEQARFTVLLNWLPLPSP